MSDEQSPDQGNPYQHAEGDYIVQASGHSTVIQNIINYQQVRPSPVDSTLLEEGIELLQKLPLDRVPHGDPLYPESVVPTMDPNPLFVGRDEDLKDLAARLNPPPCGVL